MCRVRANQKLQRILAELSVRSQQKKPVCLKGMNRVEGLPRTELLRQQAKHCAAEAAGHCAEGRSDQALTALNQAVLLYAAADAAVDPPEEPGPHHRERADACRLFGDALSAAGRHAEAANVYQEATDLYGMFSDEAALVLAKDCARKLLENVAAIRAQPRERLNLLIAHYERAQQQLALEPRTEARQAECAAHIARILQRRDQPAESVARYREALSLYERSESSAEIELARADCCHRIATMLSVHLNDLRGAIRYYRTAIALYETYEPPVHGAQPSLELCRAALARILAQLPQQDQGRDREWSRE